MFLSVLSEKLSATTGLSEKMSATAGLSEKLSPTTGAGSGAQLWAEFVLGLVVARYFPRLPLPGPHLVLRCAPFSHP